MKRNILYDIYILLNLLIIITMINRSITIIKSILLVLKKQDISQKEYLLVVEILCVICMQLFRSNICVQN